MSSQERGDAVGFGSLLLEWREKLEVSQNELARRLGLRDGGSAISQYERGVTSPTIRSVCDILEKLGIPGATDRERLVTFFRGPQEPAELRESLLQAINAAVNAHFDSHYKEED